MLMNSVDKLRDYASRYHRVTGQMTEMGRIADEIEAEIAERYMALPVDADGVPIRVGDKIEHRGHTGDVWLFGANEIMCTDRVCYPIGECHLVKSRTLEDVLTDKELAAIVEALTALASALSWTQPNCTSSVSSYLKDAWEAIDKLKDGRKVVDE